MDITKLKEAGWLYVVDNPGDIEVQMLRLIRTSIYLDTNIIIEMARYCNGKRASENKEKIGELYRLLCKLIKEYKICCPLGNQLIEMGVSENNTNGIEFVFDFSKNELLKPEEIETLEMDIFYDAYDNNKRCIQMVNTQGYVEEGIIIDLEERASLWQKDACKQEREAMRSVAHSLNEAKHNRKIAEDFEKLLRKEQEAYAELFKRAILNPPQLENASMDDKLKYLRTMAEFMMRAELTPYSTDEEKNNKILKYYNFLLSDHHQAIPYRKIESTLWAYRMCKDKKILGSDHLDTVWAAAYLPFVTHAFTDNAFCDLLEESGIAKMYNTKVYSMKTIDKLIEELQRL